MDEGLFGDAPKQGDLIDFIARTQTRRPSQRSQTPRPVIVLDGSELGMAAGATPDMHALRQAAARWYDANLRGKPAIMRDGTRVEFTRQGKGKTTSATKGDVLLRSVPAIRAIIENGTVVHREPGTRAGVQERLVIAAPVTLAGKTFDLAVSVHRTGDGQYQYDLSVDRDAPASRRPSIAPAETPRMTRGGRQGPLPSLEAPRLEPGDLNLFVWAGDNKGSGAAGARIVSALKASPFGSLIDPLMASRRLRIETTTSVPADMPPGTTAWTDPDGTMHIIAADDADPAMAVVDLLHEAFHSGAQSLVGDATWRKLLDGLSGHLRLARASKGAENAFYRRAAESVGYAEDVGGQMDADLSAEEFGAYLVSHYEEAPASLKGWADRIIGAVKAWLLRRFGIQAGDVTAAQMRAIAVAALRSAANRAGRASSAAERRLFGSGTQATVERGPQGFAIVSVPAGTDRQAIRAYHGSPHDFDRFSLDKIGTGEGAQAYGHGLYFAEARGTAQAYREVLPASHAGASSTARNLAGTYLRDHGWDSEAAAQALEEEARKMGRLGRFRDPQTASDLKEAAALARRGRMYEVSIDASPDDFLDWDKPLSEQPAVAEKFLPTSISQGADGRWYTRNVAGDVVGAQGGWDAREMAQESFRILADPSMTGADLYRMTDPADQAQIMRDAGIKGVRYKDAQSRGRDGGTSNFVVFDDALITIVSKDGRPRQNIRRKQPRPQAQPAAAGRGQNGGPPLDADARAVLERVGESKRPPSWTWDSLYTEVKDDLWPIRRAVQQMTGGERLPERVDPYIIARLTRGSTGRAEHFINHSPFRFDNLADVGKSLKAILEPHQNDIDGFVAYAIAKRALELQGRNIKTGVPAREAANTVARGEGRYRKAFRELQAYQRHLVEYVRDAGLISDDMMASMMEANRDYVPFFRILDEDGAPASAPRYGINTRNPIRGIRGSERQIVNPIESIIRNTHLFIGLAERNRALTALADIAATSPNGPALMKTVPRSVRPVDITEDEIRRFMREQGIEGDAKPFTVFRPNAFRPSLNQIAVFRNGEPTLYEVPRDLADAVNALDRPSHSIITRTLALPSRTLRAGAVLAPEFVIKNLIRDQGSAFVNSKSGYRPYVDFLIGLGQVIGKGESFRDWLKSGGANAALVALDRNYIDQNVIRLSDRRRVSDRVRNVVTSPLEMLRIMSELAENATRVGEYRRSRQKGRDMLSSGFQSREVTLDFARIGAKMHAVNKIVAFFNAIVEGPDRTVRRFREAPLEAFTKAAIFITVPSLLLWAANQDDPRVDELSEWDRDHHWIVATDDWRPLSAEEAAQYRGYKRQTPDGGWEKNVGTIYKIPKPFDLGLVFGSLPERVLDAYAKADPNAFRGFASNLMGAVVPNLIPTAALPIIEQWTNYDFFFGRPVVPASLEGVAPPYQSSVFTTDTAKEVGRLLGNMGLGDKSISSPMILENYVGDWTGTLGRYALQAADKALAATGLTTPYVKPAASASDLPLIRSFVARYPSANTRSIGVFYDNYERAREAERARDLLIKRGDIDAARSVDVPVSLDRIAEALGNQRRLVQTIYANPTMTPEEKRALLDRIYLNMTDLAQRANQAFDRTEETRRVRASQ